MKTIEELKQIREKTLEQVNLTGEHAGDTRIIVGMATCGLSAGARPIYDAFVNAAKLMDNVKVVKTGCIGMCRLEPIVEVLRANEPKVTYVKVKPDMVGRIIAEHIEGGAPVKEYTVGEAE